MNYSNIQKDELNKLANIGKEVIKMATYGCESKDCKGCCLADKCSHNHREGKDISRKLMMYASLVKS